MPINILVTYFHTDASIRTAYWDNVTYTKDENQKGELLIKVGDVVLRTFPQDTWISYQVTQA